MEEKDYNTEETTPEVSKKTGARIAKTIGIVALCGLVAFGGYKAYLGYLDHQETKRAESIVAQYMDNDYVVSVPETVEIAQAYDEEYCDGEKLVSELKEANAQYCIIDGDYYTNNGDKIAILTYEVTRTETVEPIKQEFGGTVIYMAPAGYTLENGACTKTITGTITKIVTANETGDYSNIKVTNVSSYELINVEEIQTLAYEEMFGKTLVCDVADNAELNENGICEGILRLKPRNK